MSSLPPVLLDVLTLNVWGLPWARHRRSRFARILDTLHGRADHIVGLQEVWGRSLRMLPLPGLGHGEERRDSGLAVGGALPAAPGRVHAFSRARGPDAWKGKGVLESFAELPGGATLRVLVTHLQAGRRHGAVRAHQVDEALELAGEEDGPVLLLGDFNLHGDHPEDEAATARIEAAGFTDAALQAGCREPTFHSHNRYVRGRDRAERFDRIYFRAGGGARVRALEAAVLEHEHPVSDHHPLWARLELRASDG